MDTKHKVIAMEQAPATAQEVQENQIMLKVLANAKSQEAKQLVVEEKVIAGVTMTAAEMMEQLMTTWEHQAPGLVV